MKQLRLGWLLLPCSLFLATCSNDFDLTAPWKEIPVVYGIISPADTAYYIRVEKAFLDPKVGAPTVAQIADSLYYPADAIAVYLQRVGSNTQYQLQRVDGNLEGYKRDTGIFANSPNWLYKLKASQAGGGLQTGATYRLVIKRADGQPDITAETVIPGNFTLSSPTLANIPPKINFIDDKTTTVAWFHDASAVYFSVRFTIPYREESGGQVIKRDTLEWQPTSNLLFTDPTNTNFAVTGNDFYSFLTQKLSNTTNRRYFGQVTITIEGGGREIREYQLTAEANAGITGAELVQTYTNMSEGYGIFTAKNRGVYTGLRIWEETIDAMAANPQTQGLNFQFF